jgi:Ca2+-binding RTX toxin-like protein
VSSNATLGDHSGGGAIFVSGSSIISLIESTLSGNMTGGGHSPGGAIQLEDYNYYYAGELKFENSTISGNKTNGDYSSGGGVFAEIYSVTRLFNSTVSGNYSLGRQASAGGLYGRNYLTNSIVAGNFSEGGGIADDDLSGAPLGWMLTGGNVLGGKLLHDGKVVGSVTEKEVFAATLEIAPSVFAGVLGDNGGPTQTIAIRADGPAAGAADPATATETDQRGFARDAAPDLGAYEAGAGGGLTLVGGPGADALVGSEFADRIRGRGGDDDLRGKGGDDAILGDSGRDTIRAWAGDDTVRGGAGVDRIGGGTGDDVLHGGKGCDVFAFGEDFGEDRIADFDADPRCGQDRIDLRPLGITEAAFAARAEVVATAGGARVEVAGEGAILLLGVGAEALDATDFLLA